MLGEHNSQQQQPGTIAWMFGCGGWEQLKTTKCKVLGTAESTPSPQDLLRGEVGKMYSSLHRAPAPTCMAPELSAWTRLQCRWCLWLCLLPSIGGGLVKGLPHNTTKTMPAMTNMELSLLRSILYYLRILAPISLWQWNAALWRGLFAWS